MSLTTNDLKKISNLITSESQNLKEEIGSDIDQKLEQNNERIGHDIDQRFQKNNLVLKKDIEELLENNNNLLVEGLSTAFAEKQSTKESLKDHESRLEKIEDHLNLASA